MMAADGKKPLMWYLGWINNKLAPFYVTAVASLTLTTYSEYLLEIGVSVG